MRKLSIFLLILFYALAAEAQQENCILKSPTVTVHFGSGNVNEQNTIVPARYQQIGGFCPSDGFYAITPYTSDCFRGDWFTLTEDHTPGDSKGNMLLINSAPRSGIFLNSSISGLKGGTKYEFAVWMMNVCRITEKCPYPLLPDITIHLRTTDGKNIAQLETGELARVTSPQWKQYRFIFNTPPGETGLTLVMVNHAPGGCGNDFVLDDITFRECVPPPPPPIAKKQQTTAVLKKQPAASATIAKKPTPAPVKKPTTAPVKKPVSKTPAVTAKKNVSTAPKKNVSSPPKKTIAKAPVKPATSASKNTLPTTKTDSIKIAPPIVRQRTIAFPPPPPVLRNRTNALVRQINTDAGEIKIDLYDNGEIDDDTVSIYHNNTLLMSRARLSQKPITFYIKIDETKPLHELIMVAENLGSIPPNTSLMIVTTKTERHEVFISSTKQKNAKMVLQLKD